MQDLREVLIAGGASGLNGWKLSLARAITPNGRTIVGWGPNPVGNQEAWAATIPEPNTFTLLTLASFALLAIWARQR
jgi:hypothetical protein